MAILQMYHEGNTCLVRQSLSPCSLRDSFISPGDEGSNIGPGGL